MWLGYVALEPYVRRRWPHTLIAWSRLLSGRVRDAMVGRDVLIGIISGVALVSIIHLARLAPGWIGRPIAPPFQFATSTLGSMRHVAYALLSSITTFVIAALALTAGVVVNRVILRSQILAVAVVFVGLGAAFLGMGITPVPVLVIYAALNAGALMFVMIRWGLLALTVMGTISWWLRLVPLTLDSTRGTSANRFSSWR